MKKFLSLLIPVFALVFLVSSCSKDDDNNNTNPQTVQGTWTGMGQYGAGNPSYVFSINFKAGGTVDIIGNNSVAIDNAVGTWQMVGDSVHATYIYTSSSAVYKLSGKFSSSSNVMAGTIGLDPVTTGAGVFSVTRQ